MGVLISLTIGLMEDLQFGRIILHKFTAVIGEECAIVVTGVVFTVMHEAASYMKPVEALLFWVILLPISLLFGYLTVKTNNVWSVVLFHVGSDVFLFYLMGW
jgi:membrane protease YdiL (CAAX protease family)